MLKKKIVKLISTYAFISDPQAAIPVPLKKTIFWNTQDPYLYFRSTPDNRILVGGADERFKDSFTRDKLIDKKEIFLADSQTDNTIGRINSGFFMGRNFRFDKRLTTLHWSPSGLSKKLFCAWLWRKLHYLQRYGK
ncbi:MAG: hypothetical protein C0490_08695 [Marivirga sp.]|nr:hypothetical protein [Marivirga sp.]